MTTTPLAQQLRPKSLEDLYGQDHLVGAEGLITRIIQGGIPLSILLWGPPGCGKTTLARLYAQSFGARFETLSAVSGGVADLKRLVKEVHAHPLLHTRLILFVDELHRFHKGQQDAFLPHIEDGTIVLVGATTENPSFALNSALLSRLRVLTLKHLDDRAMAHILRRYEERHRPLPLTAEAKSALIQMSHGDGRHLLNLVENLHSLGNPVNLLDTSALLPLLQRRPARYDKEGDCHYDLISALHKAVRGSDPDAALYWLSRLLEGGEDPCFLARRIVRIASEDVGLADPNALDVSLNAWRAYEQLGAPEGELALAQAIIYLSLAPKSNALYTAFKRARELAKDTSHLWPPKHILNAPTPLMQKMGYAKGYAYDHDTEEGCSGQHYFPDEMPPTPLYHPVERGFEREMKKRLDYFAKFRQKKTSADPSPASLGQDAAKVDGEKIRFPGLNG